MTDLTRRKFTGLAGASLAALATTPLFAPAVLGQPKAKPKLVVHRRRSRRRHGRALRQQGRRGRDRRHA